MKNLINKTLFVFFALILLIMSCRKFNENLTAPIEYEPDYSSLTDFRNGLAKVDSIVKAKHIVAYLDTLPNGYPNVQGRKTPLAEFVTIILSKYDCGQVESAVNDVFHFDGSTFSLISYLMKAQMAGDISYEAFIDIFTYIPLPPVPMIGFAPPLKPKLAAAATCDPKVRLYIIFTYRKPCGNSVKNDTVWAAGNQLNNMEHGKMYRILAEPNGCTHGGTWTNSVTTDIPDLVAMPGKEGNSMTVFAQSAGTASITFTYKCNLTGKIASQTFKLNFR